MLMAVNVQTCAMNADVMAEGSEILPVAFV